MKDEKFICATMYPKLSIRCAGVRFFILFTHLLISLITFLVKKKAEGNVQ